MKTILGLSKKSSHRVTLRQLKSYKRDSLVTQGQFLHDELPIRLSKRVIELQRLEDDLDGNPHIASVKNLYIKSTERLLDFPVIKDMEKAEEFSGLLSSIKHDHRFITDNVSKGILEMAKQDDTAYLNKFLDQFYNARIGLRILLGQYISLTENDHGIVESFNPVDVAQDSISYVSRLSEMCYGERPKINIRGDIDFEVTYVPSFLNYILTETLKNSARATLELHKDNFEDYPINIYFTKGKDDLIIKVSDKGGGFPRGKTEKIMSYYYTTSESNVFNNFKEEDDAKYICGFGHGLPMSRLYAQYFGGDYSVIPYYGKGCKTIIYISRMQDRCEKI
jgi:pyruvate dehydrogenase kinase 2/3/4